MHSRRTDTQRPVSLGNVLILERWQNTVNDVPGSGEETGEGYGGLEIIAWWMRTGCGV